MENLNNLSKLKSKNRPAKRVGRGAGSGKGFHTATFGSKGQNSRSGGKKSLGFEGGQLPLIKRLPYLGGFRNINKTKVFELNLNDIYNSPEKDLNAETLLNKLNKKTHKYDVIKILGSGNFEKDRELSLTGFKYTKKAREILSKQKKVVIVE